MGEILAPVGSDAMLAAALHAGADAVYLGLDEGFNARAKSRGFACADLPEIVHRVHRAGARLYVTLNTLVFEGELPRVARLLETIARAGVDAIIVQDPAVCRLARAICPALAIHASTQMTISSPEAAAFAERLGARRCVVPRELSVDQIARFAEACALELEVFVHGALCMAWSGQCLSGEAWVGRSANRGQCNQGCRLPYDLIVDDQKVDLGEVRYLLSPKDLAGVRALPRLLEIGVAALKIEGRYKSPAYVAHNVETYQRWRAAIARGEATELADLREHLLRSELIYSRGFSDGHFGGSDHRNLVDGRFPRHRGVFLGYVESIAGDRVRVRRAERLPEPGIRRGRLQLPVLGGHPEASSSVPSAEIELVTGMGIVFDDGQPEDREEAGGPLHRARMLGGAEGLVELDFGGRGRRLSSLRAGQRVWVSGDPKAHAQVAKRIKQVPPGRRPLEIWVQGEVGTPLGLRARSGFAEVLVASETVLTAAAGSDAEADRSRMLAKLSALGSSEFELHAVYTDQLSPGLFLPPSQLKSLRRHMVAALGAELAKGERRVVADGHACLQRLKVDEPKTPNTGAQNDSSPWPQLRVLCRTMDQLQACTRAGLTDVELDWMEFVGLSAAVRYARAQGMRVTIATVRVQKPGESGYDRRIVDLEPDAILVRHWGALMAAQGRESGPALIGDFSLNVTNSLTAATLFELGLSQLTLSHDLNASQVAELLAASAPERFILTLHHHLPLFHNDHCVYAKHLSEGRDFRSCGRPCDHHRIHLRDQAGDEHPVIVDVECRNTVFNARAQSAVRQLPQLRRLGLKHFRLELAWEQPAEVERMIETYRACLAGGISEDELLARVAGIERFGVSEGTIAVSR